MPPFKAPPKIEKNSRIQLENHANHINQLLQGKTNNTGSVTLTANAGTTTLIESGNRIGNDTVILFMPTTANAATGITALYVSARDITLNTFTLTHTNNAQTDRIYNYILVG